MGTLYIISAPSGAGKSSLIHALLTQTTDIKASISISHTTRPQRPGEVHGEHYFFVDHTTFEKMIEEDMFLEYAQVFDNYYGTSRITIEEKLAKGIDVFLDIDWQGARQVRKKIPAAKSLFILPPSKATLEQRLFSRGQDNHDVIQKRMTKATAEISHYNEYDYLIINDDFSHALQEIKTIIHAEKLKMPHQNIKYQALIRNLLAE